MMALSMWQPWASLWLTDAKVHETRPWECRYRGWLAVHAAKRKPGELPTMLEAITEHRFGLGWRNKIPFGAVIGAVYITDCYATDNAPVGATDFHCGDYAPGRFAIKRTEFFALDKPTPLIGRQRYFYLPEELDRDMGNIVIERDLPDAAVIADARKTIDTMSLRAR